MSRNDAAAPQRLFVYGTLAPGEVNAHVLEPLVGEWQEASVRGTLHPQGWGQTHGFPALRVDAGAAAVEGLVFQSADLPAYWARLDEFEGSAYQRVETDALLKDGTRCKTCVYVLSEEVVADLDQAPVFGQFFIESRISKQ
jgi:gamma-glutamylcyclotransferase (GGCT)/AIG2-like uncharacterized protein YtfP